MSILNWEEKNDKSHDYSNSSVDMRGRAYSKGKDDCKTMNYMMYIMLMVGLIIELE